MGLFLLYMILKYQEYLFFERRLSKATVIAYVKDINQYLLFLEFQIGLNDPIKAKRAHVRSWVASLVNLGLDHRSVNRKLSALKGFYKFLAEVEELDKNPTEGIPSLKEKKRIVRALTQDEMNLLLNENLFLDDRCGRRDRFILFTLYAFGLRRSELLGLQMNSIDIRGSKIRGLGKRNKERELPCIPEWLELYKIHCHDWPELELKETLFFEENGNSLDPRRLYSIVHSYINKVSNIDSKSPHILRHTFATHLLDMGADLSSIRELLGHANLSATQIYTHASMEHLKSVYLKSHPRS